MVLEVGKPKARAAGPLGASLDGWTGATGWWAAKDGARTASLPKSVDAAMYTRGRHGDFTATFDLTVTEAAIFGLRFRGGVTNPDKHILDGPMFLFGGPDHTGEGGRRYAWFTTMGLPRYEWANGPDNASEIGQLVRSGKPNRITVAVTGSRVTAKLHDEVVWGGTVRDMRPEGVIGLVTVTKSGGGSVVVKDFKVR